MFNEIKQLGKQTFIYGLGSVASSAINFLLLPVYTRLLTTADYGMLDLLTSFSAIVSLFFAAGISTALFKVYFRDCATEQEKKKCISSAIIFLMASGFFVFSMICLNLDFISKLLLGDAKHHHYILIVSATMVFNVLISIPMAVFRAKDKPKRFVLLTTSQLLMNILLNILFVVQFRWGIMGVLYAGIISSGTICLSMIPYLIWQNGINLSLPLLKKMLVFGIPLIPVGAGLWIINLSNRYFMKSFLDFNQIGIFALGYRLGMIIQILIVNPLQIAWPPFMFKMATKEDAKQLYARAFKFYVLLATFLSFLLSIFSIDIVRIMSSPAFTSAYKVVPYLAFANAIYGIHVILLSGLWIKEKISEYPVTVMAAAGVNVVLNYFLIPRLLITGAALAVLGSYFVMSFSIYLMAQKYYPVPYLSWKTARLILITVFFIILGSQIPGNLPILSSILLHSLLFICLIPSLFLLKIITFEEIKNLKKLVNS
jgi:O-antigen/teichoic acid export membrane protein